MGKPACRVTWDGSSNDKAPIPADEELVSALAKPGFYYSKVETSQLRLLHALEKHGFRLIDTNVTLAADIGKIEAHLSNDVRLATALDKNAVMNVARSAFTQSRFHLDPLIPISLANEIKAAWAGNYFSGNRGQHMVVAEQRGTVVGFMQLLADAAQDLTIDLIGVDTVCRGQGLGRSMIGFALRSCGRPRRIQVGTQVANIRSLRFYEALGFRVTASSYVLHLHRNG